MKPDQTADAAELRHRAEARLQSQTAPANAPGRRTKRNGGGWQKFGRELK